MATKLLFSVLLAVSVLVLGSSAEWRWKNKVAVVTGASSGIGMEIALQLAEKGMIVAGLARTEHKLKELAESSKGVIRPVVCDLTNEQDVIKAFQWIKDNLGGVDVLINNAGAYVSTPLMTLDRKSWDTQFDLNALGAALSTREALKTMRARGDDGHIVNINSIFGQSIHHYKGYFNGIYSASKYALRAISEALSNELSDAGSKIKVTNLSPGLVFPKMTANSSEVDPERKKYYESEPHINVDDVAEGVIYVLNTRPGVFVPELTIRHMVPQAGC